MNVQFSRRQEHDGEAAYLTKESFVIDVRRIEVNEGGSLFGDLIKWPKKHSSVGHVCIGLLSARNQEIYFPLFNFVSRRDVSFCSRSLKGTQSHQLIRKSFSLRFFSSRKSTDLFFLPANIGPSTGSYLLLRGIIRTVRVGFHATSSFRKMYKNGLNSN